MTEVNKAQTVRDYIAAHRKAKPREVAAALSAQGVKGGLPSREARGLFLVCR